MQESEDTLGYVWPAPPCYTFHEKPCLLASALPGDCAHIAHGKEKWKGKAFLPHFWRRARWSPDGRHILAQTEDHAVDVLRYGPSLPGQDSILSGGPISACLTQVSTHRAPSPLLDAIWYPFAVGSSGPHTGSGSAETDGQAVLTADANAWCYAVSARDVPIRLVNAGDGSTRASYGIIDHTERFVAPHSMAFSLDGTRLYCGHSSSIAIFDITQPGLNTHATLALRGTRRQRGGQHGIVSALAVAPRSGWAAENGAGGAGEMLAVGTFAGSVGLYAPDEGECYAGWKEDEGSGITQLAFHPLAPHILFVSFRRSPYIKAYDTRFLSSTRFSSPPSPSSLLATFSRGSSAPAERLEGHASEQETAQDGEANTHQRLSFDIDWAGRWLVAGSASGTVSAWKISGEPFVGVNEYQEAALKPETKEGRDPDGPLEFVKPYASWKAHDDAIGSATLHPLEPCLLTVSGSRHWPSTGAGRNPSASSASPDPQHSSGEEDSDSDSDFDSEDGRDGTRSSESAKVGPEPPYCTTRDAAMRVWDLR